MKQRFNFIFIFIVVSMMLLCGCVEVPEPPEEVSRTIVDASYTPAYDSVETEVHYKFNPLGEETFKLMPDVHSVHHPEVYAIQYKVEYADGTSKTVWEATTFVQYKTACEEIGKPLGIG